MADYGGAWAGVAGGSTPSLDPIDRGWAVPIVAADGPLPDEAVASVTVSQADNGRIVAEFERPGDRPPLDADAWTLDAPSRIGPGDEGEITISIDPALAGDEEILGRLLFSSDGGETWKATHAGFMDASELERLVVDGSRLAASTPATEDGRFGLLVSDGRSTVLDESDPVQIDPGPPTLEFGAGVPVPRDADRAVLGGTFAGTIPPEVGPRGVPLTLGETTRPQVQGLTDAWDRLGPDDVEWSVRRIGLEELEDIGIPNGTMLYPNEGEPVSLRHVLQATGVGAEATAEVLLQDRAPFLTDVRGNGEANAIAFSEPGVYQLQATATDPDTGLETTRNATMVVTPEIDADRMPGEDGFIDAGSEGNAAPVPGVVVVLSAVGMAASVWSRRRGPRP